MSWRQLWAVQMAWGHLPMQKGGVASVQVGHGEAEPSRERWLQMRPRAGAGWGRRGRVNITIPINLATRTMVPKSL